jgi:transcriptional regulator with XRE-family HTH domain
MARMTAKLSQTELADRIGVTFQQVQKYERGANRVGSGRLVRIAEALGKQIAWFSEGASTDAKVKPVADPLTVLGQTRDGVRLAEAFNAIADKNMRASIVSTAEAAAA